MATYPRGPRSQHITADGDGAGCKCPACLVSEQPQREIEVPYRNRARSGLAAFHLLLHSFLPVIGVVLIGRSWLAVAPVLGSLAAYLVNSFILCPTCAYHHAGVRFCGCYPKSVFPYKQYGGKRWGPRENIFGRSLVISMTIGPSLLILGARGDRLAVLVLLVSAITVIFLTSVVSCPNCRQRDVCCLGKLTTAGIRRENI